MSLGPGPGNETVDLHQWTNTLRPSRQFHIEVNQDQLTGAEAEQLLAMLSGDLCVARYASAKINAIKSRLAAATEDHC
jgi:hypothetical protein